MDDITERTEGLPWVVSVSMRDAGGDEVLLTGVITLPASESPPDCTQYVPDGYELLRSECYPATRFDSLPQSVRRRYILQYTFYQLWCLARRLNLADGVKPLPWVHYDPIEMGLSTERWAESAPSGALH